jgi:small subunit ribosomal protein S34
VIINRTNKMSIKLVGRTTDYKGNTLWELVSNLKNFGVGRVIG